ncbi:MAG: serine/threonine-protein kinase [Anaerolineales bacterium]|nr:serine/threonine-protein kinase [Anaerolineales bacterium]
MELDKIGRYEIKAELGRGGMATVYRGYDPRFEREVAIKFLPPELIHSDPQFRVRFEREAKIIAQLEHPSIVPVYDVGEENGQPYFVMRYMSGGSLSERIKAGIFSVEDALKILEQIAPGMDEAHSKGIVHRDLKPGNILFTNRNVALISDFGIAKFTQGEAGSMTGSAIIGTPAYMAPEQAGGEAVDGRADIYALGVILYEMVTGKQPYKADTPLAVAIKHMTEPVPRILQANPSLPVWMEKVISTAMAKDRDDRFSTAVEMVETIKAFMRGETTPATIKAEKVTQKISAFNKTVTEKPVAEKTFVAKTKSRFPMGLIAGLFVLILLGGGVFLLGSYMLPLVKVAPTSAPTLSEATSAPLIIEITETPSTVETATEAPVAVTETPSTPALSAIGGADKIAFIRNNDVWMMNVDGSDPKQLTTDGVEKFNLQWLPDGNTLLYMSGKSVKTVEIESLREEVIFNYLSAEYFESFSVSPDGTQAALVINRELFVVPFDLEKLKSASRKSALLDMKGCLFYNELAVKGAKWSDDGTRLAIKYIANVNQKFADAIRIMDISKCNDVPPDRIDDFPSGRFKFSNEIVNYDYDGDLLFFINSNVRNGGYGDLVFYNSFTHKFEEDAPYEGNCCYRDAAFSPDGSYVIFAFQDIRLGGESPTNLYYLPVDTLSQSRTLEPIPLPDDFFSRTDAPMPALRPAQP